MRDDLSREEMEAAILVHRTADDIREGRSKRKIVKEIMERTNLPKKSAKQLVKDIETKIREAEEAQGRSTGSSVTYGLILICIGIALIAEGASRGGTAGIIEKIIGIALGFAGGIILYCIIASRLWRPPYG